MFCYNNNRLILNQKGFSDFDLLTFARKRKNPFYIYDINHIKERYEFIKEEIPNLEIFFSMKSNNNKHVLNSFLQNGSGLDIVSQGEMRLANQIGFSHSQMVFSGVGKREEEIEEAISKSILQINVESFSELKLIQNVAHRLKKEINIALRINPNVDFESHPYIKTGLLEHKFGIDETDLPEILKFIKEHKELKLTGLSIHIGSQIFDLKPFFEAISYVKNLYEDLKKEQLSLKILDIGGGFGINYQNENSLDDHNLIKDFSKQFKELFKHFQDRILSEPGRFLVARAGLLCSQVQYVKKNTKKTFIILNTGMHHFMRPALYQAQHLIKPFILRADCESQIYDVVGPICETADTFYKNCKLHPVYENDFVGISDVGAYGYVFSNSYNLQTPVEEIAIENGKLLDI